MVLHANKFYEGPEDFRQFCLRLKLTACPHCQRTGFLIRHGFLFGYNENTVNSKVQRGSRFYCSNRNRRSGCGRTFSLLAAHILRKFTLSTNGLWAVLRGFLNGLCKLEAFRRAKIAFATSSAYRIFRRVFRAQHRIRTKLQDNFQASAYTDHHDPLVLTIRHLQTAFPSASNPLSAFQVYFQTSVF